MARRSDMARQGRAGSGVGKTKLGLVGCWAQVFKEYSVKECSV
jgi:hypothetical protein